MNHEERYGRGVEILRRVGGPDFDAPLKALEDQQVSKPFRTEAGWHIVQRLGSRQADVGEQNRRAQIGETIGRRKLEDEWNRFLRELRGEVGNRHGRAIVLGE